ncbi:MAG: DUF2330 domain-containing protein [Crocinitomicaceae bacterium]
MKNQMLLSMLILLGVSTQGLSFCGFYVAKADTKLFNKTSQVILVRDGNKTTVTMANDFKGNVKDFAMVIPVPAVLQRKDIKIAENSLFSKLDSYSGPRLVEYNEVNPCSPSISRLEYYENESIRELSDISVTAVKSERRKKLGVTIEAQYKVDEYDILILSAKQSGGLKIWLTENGYKIPAEAESVLEPYIKNNMKFFVVKVDAEKLNSMSNLGSVKKYIKDLDTENVQNLRPLQITYESPKFMLPIRLGMANANGDQDMIVYAFTKKGRVECTNYRTTKIPSNQNVPLFVRQKFGQFYVDLFEKAHKAQGKEAIFLEYAWNISPQFRGMKCDPCVGPPPIFTDLVKAGVHWAINNSNQASGQVFFTRLHVRYSRATHPRDLEFQVTPNKEHFQARYVLTNRAHGDLTCEAGQKYCAKVVKERAAELDNLENLTAWNTAKHSNYVQEYYDLLIDPSLLKSVEPTKNSIIPILKNRGNDPKQGYKIGVILTFVLIICALFYRKRKLQKLAI